jgi:hypothetical protein
LLITIVLIQFSGMDAPRTIRVLIIGLGGGLLLLYLVSRLGARCCVDSIECEAAVIEAAAECFGCTAPIINVVHADGVGWIKKAAAQQREWDVVLFDAFTIDGSPAPVYEADFIASVAAVIVNGGCFACNTFKDDTRHKQLVRNLRHSIGVTSSFTTAGNRCIFASKTTNADFNLSDICMGDAASLAGPYFTFHHVSRTLVLKMAFMLQRNRSFSGVTAKLEWDPFFFSGVTAKLELVFFSGITAKLELDPTVAMDQCLENGFRRSKRKRCIA